MTKQGEFWKWFNKHENELLNFEQDQERVFDKLADQLKKVDPNLTFEFGQRARAESLLLAREGSGARSPQFLRLWLQLQPWTIGKSLHSVRVAGLPTS